MSNFLDLKILLWIFRNVCLPVGLPILLYKLFDNYKKKNVSLHGKVVVITGASSGIGEALAHVFYVQGCRVVLAARREEELMRVKRDLLSKKLTTTTFAPIVLPLDLAAIHELDSKIHRIYEEYGDIDILINNGGISTRSSVLETDIDVDKEVMTVNYFGPVTLTKCVLPRMVNRNSGHIVFVSSVQGRIAIPSRSSYAASKHALQAFADTLRSEVDKHNIKVSVISPGYVKTALSLNALTGSGEKYGVMDKATAKGYTPEHVANQVLNMISKNTKELTLSTIGPKAAIAIRYLAPDLYFWIMAKRARSMQ